MTYSVKNSAQTTTYTVNDNTENSTSTSLVFIGKNYTGYGLALNENFLYLLENFSNTVGNYPLNPVPGQLFWDNTNKYMHVYDGTAWKVIYGALASLTVNSAVSFNGITTSNGGQVSGYLTGAIGANLANSGVFTTVAASTVNANVLGNTGSSIYGVIATNAQPFITSIGTLTGLTSSANITAQTANVYAAYVVANTGLYGPVATNAQTNITSTGALTSPSFTTSSGGQLTGYLTGAIGANSANSGAFTTITSTSNITAQTANMYAANHIANTATYSAAYYWANGTAFASSNYGNTQVAGYLGVVETNIVPSSNVSVNLGSTSNYWNNVYAVNFLGTSTTAKYADLAEKYLPDTDYEIGTVMMVGGVAEVTQHSGDKIRAIGVTSAYPAYKMNSDLDGGVYVALKGRVPVRVVGPVKKGQSLFGSAHGLAMATDDTTPTSFAIALESFDGNGIGSIEAVIL